MPTTCKRCGSQFYAVAAYEAHKCAPKPKPEKTPTAPTEFYTVAEAAALLRVSEATLRRRIKDQTLPAAQLAGTRRILIRRADLLRLLEGT